MLRVAFFLVTIFLLPWSVAQTSPIYYEVNNLSGNSWEYSYTVDNQLTTPIDEFTVWFTLGMYENLAITGSPTPDWDGFTAEPDPGLPDDGYADWATYGLSIDPGEVLGGFSVTFDYLGAGTPGEQFFELFDANFDLLSDGQTQLLVVMPPASVPEPSMPLLLALGLSGLFWSRLRQI